jgi:Holliday junction resolvase
MTNASVAKGTRGEHVAIAALNKHSGLDFKRVPLSGAGHIKGDIFLVNKANRFCIECKNYSEDHLTSKILTSKDSQFEKWWLQATEQAEKSKQEPLLIFKFNRSKLFVATYVEMVSDKYKYFILHPHKIYIAKLEEWLTHEDIKWIL